MHITLFSFSAGAACKHDQTKFLLISGLLFHALPAIICCIFFTHITVFIIMNIFLCSNDKSENISRLPCNLWGHCSIYVSHVNRASVGLPWAPSRRYHLHLLNPDQSSTAPWLESLESLHGSCGSCGTVAAPKRSKNVEKSDTSTSGQDEGHSMKHANLVTWCQCQSLWLWSFS